VVSGGASVSAFRLRISAKTLSCTASAFLVVSSMNWSAFVSFSQAGGPSGDDMNWSAFVPSCLSVFSFLGKERERNWGRERLLGFFLSICGYVRGGSGTRPKIFSKPDNRPDPFGF
jgi:hypothetical protein